MLEIVKLHYLLEDAGIPHTFEKRDSELYGENAYQIRMYSNAEMTDELDDCIYNRYSHGYAEGLLETYFLNGCRGYETAEQVFEGWAKMYNPNKELYHVVVSACASLEIFAESEKEAKALALEAVEEGIDWDVVAEVVEKV